MTLPTRTTCCRLASTCQRLTAATQTPLDGSFRDETLDRFFEKKRADHTEDEALELDASDDRSCTTLKQNLKPLKLHFLQPKMKP